MRGGGGGGVDGDGGVDGGGGGDGEAEGGGEGNAEGGGAGDAEGGGDRSSGSLEKPRTGLASRLSATSMYVRMGGAAAVAAAAAAGPRGYQERSNRERANTMTKEKPRKKKRVEELPAS